MTSVGQEPHALPPLPAALLLPSPQRTLAASGRHSMGDDSPRSSVSPPGLPTTVFLISFFVISVLGHLAATITKQTTVLKRKFCDISLLLFYEDVDIFEHVGLLKTNPLGSIMFCDLCNVYGTHLSFALQIGPKLHLELKLCILISTNARSMQ